MKINFGICFSRDFEGVSPLGHIGVKLPVYLRLLDLCQKEGWDTYVLTRQTYKGGGIFDGVWKYEKQKFTKVDEKIKIDIVYDRTGGIKFPLKGDRLTVINNLDFKILAWDKFKTYGQIGEFMPKTVWLKDIDQIKSDWIVAKPFNGLEGKGIYIGSRKKLTKKDLMPGKKYVVQEYIDTSSGIPAIATGMHDLRVVVVNGEVVWCHVRTPKAGMLLANRAQGGSLTEVDYKIVPDFIKKVVEIISEKFYKKYDNPIFSLDFGIQNKTTPKIFEINDQIGFPRWEMKNRDTFLKALLENFKSKIT